MISRRKLLRLAPLGLVAPAGLFVPRRLLAADAATDRKFLFVYAYGGWDPTMCFAPMFDAPEVDVEADAVQAEANGIPFVDSAERPSVRTFFETYGDRACVINGLEVRSVTHERCQRILFTGSSETAEDWGVILAAGGGAYPVPHLVLSGPAFASTNISGVVRSGEVGQLVQLLDGTALEASTQVVVPPSATAALAEDAFLRARIRSFTEGSADGARRLGEVYGQTLEDLDVLLAASGGIDLDPEQTGCRRDVARDAEVAFNAFEYGLSRCAITEDAGWCSMSWDTHSDNQSLQSRSFEELFGYLNTLMADLDTRTGLSGNPLRDEVTIVVFSEMGRHPKVTNGGRAHWTYTSAMLIGAGVRGGRVIGGMNESYEGRGVNLATGEVDDDAGVGLVSQHLGATLLAIGDVDPAEYVPGYEPILGAME